MVKKLLLIAMLVPFLLIMGCDLLGLTEEEEIVYGTPDAALVSNVSEVYIVIGAGDDAADEELNGDLIIDENGNMSYTGAGIVLTGTRSMSLNDDMTIMTVAEAYSIVFTNFTVEGSDISISGSYAVNMDMTMDMGTVEMTSGSMSVAGNLVITGSDISAIEFDVTVDMVEGIVSGDVIVDGVYYHAADLDV